MLISHSDIFFLKCPSLLPILKNLAPLVCALLLHFPTCPPRAFCLSSGQCWCSSNIICFENLLHVVPLTVHSVDDCPMTAIGFYSLHIFPPPAEPSAFPQRGAHLLTAGWASIQLGSQVGQFALFPFELKAGFVRV